MYTSFLHSMKVHGYKLKIKFNKDPSAVEQKNYRTKIVKGYFVYESGDWPNNPLKNFTLKLPVCCCN